MLFSECNDQGDGSISTIASRGTEMYDLNGDRGWSAAPVNLIGHGDDAGAYGQ